MAGGRALFDSAKVCRDNGFEPKLYQMLSRNSGGQKAVFGAFIMMTQPLRWISRSSPYKPDLFMEQRSRRHVKIMCSILNGYDFTLSYFVLFTCRFPKM